jgi:hypothetical protein
MRSDSQNSGARGTTIARQRLCKQSTIPEPSLGNESASNNGGTVESGVFSAVTTITGIHSKV